jgi:ubiquinol-cytochrome c reductase cytochrome c1 subunit
MRLASWRLLSDLETIMKLKTSLTVALAALVIGAGGVSAAEGQKEAKQVDYSFEGPFGHWDVGQLQRGYKVYKEVCANCHSMELVSFRNLAESEIFEPAEVKALAASYKVKDFDSAGEAIERDGLPSDKFPSPYPNKEASQAANGGAYPPDLSLLTKARAGWYGTWRQLYDGIGGSEYVYSVLTGYEKADGKHACPEGKHYNPYFASGSCLGMAAPLTDGQVTFDDGAKNGADDMARDVSAFLAWTAEPHMIDRKALGLKVIAFLMVLAGLLYLVKQKVWADVEY